MYYTVYNVCFFKKNESNIYESIKVERTSREQGKSRKGEESII